ncbi:MAG: hypothetical protein BWX86_02469 [Verrucomicrobia bacterium ADurb.Bin122]|nr:MAG: hypothetical protein BWX86_02469 [Verrucomicrobia bacterium ADurb.Bin122]
MSEQWEGRAGDFVERVAGVALEGRIGVADASLGIGDDDGFVGLFNGGGELLPACALMLELGDVGDEEDGSVCRAPRGGEGRELELPPAGAQREDTPAFFAVEGAA